MSVRNAMFNHGIVLKQKEFDIPIIVVGNLSMGGSGKTPHTEYIVESLCSKYNIGVLSRGYKRKTVTSRIRFTGNSVNAESR